MRTTTKYKVKRREQLLHSRTEPKTRALR